MQRWISRALGLASLGFALASPEVRAAAQAPEAPATGSADGLVTLTRDFTLTVTEDGPNQPWTVTVANRGSEPIGFIADPGLLWFDVTLPGRATQSCRLPEPLRPSSMQRKSLLVLAPGEQYSRRFDPRFFCFAELGQVLLVPHAKVTPNFGWLRESVAAFRPAPAKPKARNSKRTASAEPVAPLPAPATDARFIAWRLPAAKADAAAPPLPSSQEEGSDEDESPANPMVGVWQMPTEGLKSIQGPTLELSDSYATWMGATGREKPRDLDLLLLAGSDADDERNATVTFGVLNSLNRPQQVFVRREVLEYDVQGPDGYFECPGTETGSPDFASFSTLAPHSAERAVVRLIEVCPRRSFSRPGLYEVRARLAARWSGQELGLDAFVGQLDTQRPAFVRVRSGDRSSFARLVVPPSTPNAPAKAAGRPGAPGEAAPDAPGNDDTPDNNGPDDAPGAPDQPPPPAPPDAPPVE